MKIENIEGLRLLKAAEGMLLYRKSESDDDRTYHEEIYLGNFDGIENYGEVTHDYVYGKNYDEQIKNLTERVNMQDNIIEQLTKVVDFLLLDCDIKPNTTAEVVMPAYFASRILNSKVEYSNVVKSYPECKEDIDNILAKAKA